MLRKKKLHTHKCFCGNTWQHSEDSVDNKQDHTCCNCQSVVWQKYDERFLTEDEWKIEMIMGLSPAQVYQALSDYVLELNNPLKQGE